MNRVPAAAGTEHRGEPGPVGVPNEIENSGRKKFGEFIDVLGTPRRLLTSKTPPEPSKRPKKQIERADHASSSMISGMRSQGRMSPQPT